MKTKTKSPFSSDGLFNYVQNDGDFLHNAFYNATKTLVNYMNMAATKLQKANSEWHDDPEADDHKLFHQPPDKMFPTQMRDKAILDLVKRHLEIIRENEREATVNEELNELNKKH